MVITRKVARMMCSPSLALSSGLPQCISKIFYGESIFVSEAMDNAPSTEELEAVGLRCYEAVQCHSACRFGQLSRAEEST